MKSPRFFVCLLGVFLSVLSPGATVHLGPYQTTPANSDSTGAVNQSVSYTIDLSNLTGLTMGAPIQIDFSPASPVVWTGGFRAETGPLAFAWRAEMEISVGGFSTTFADISSFGPAPFEHDPATGGYAVYEIGPTPVTRSLVVPWGTDLSNLTFTLRDHSQILSGVPGASLTSAVEGTGATWVTSSVAAPEIGIELNGGSLLTNQAAVDFGTTVPGKPRTILFTIRNTGSSPLILSGASLSGTNGAEFSVSPALTGTVPVGGSLDFTIFFTPVAAGVREGVFTLLNNDADESSFGLMLSGNALSFSTDSDTDGLNDAAEFNLAALGFDWQTNQTMLVATLFDNASGAGLFTAAQVQTLNAGTPLIARDPESGRVKLTIDWKKSTNLTDFQDFPAPPGSAVSITPQGNVEFDFPSTENSAFYRIKFN